MLKTGVVLTLQIHNDEGVNKYRCKVQEMNEKEIYVDYPVQMNNGKTTYILNGTELNVTFVTEDGQAYSFESEVIGRIKQIIPMIQLSYPGHSNLFKIQRREYLRVDSNVDVAVHPISVDFKPFTTVTHDISAGGCSIYLQPNMEIPELKTIVTNLVFHLNNGDIHYLKLKSKVIRVVDQQNGSKRASLQFDFITENEKQIIIKYCFEQQLLLRKTQ
ncbi:flagellar brake protein [Sutcliffiella halmapala]|uniref:flagellar brake protein n=1 Tax=Sutcliffiella halmapala TaxID=79882 RepID=UPI000994A437|nr:flagellar brake domain-containing protein [Sutcliffiella halmapala]